MGCKLWVPNKLLWGAMIGCNKQDINRNSKKSILIDAHRNRASQIKIIAISEHKWTHWR